MKNLFKKFLDKVKKEKGLVIIEATIVFPVMFFVLFFIIYIGNAYFQIAQVDDCVSRAALKGAQCIANPQQYETVDEGMIPLKVNNAEPYRYIIGELPGGSINEIERKIENDLIKEINESTLSFFIKMNPKVTGSTDKIAEFNNYFLYSTFKVGVKYEVRFPIRFFGAAEPTILRLQSHAEVAVSDTPEFVRNVDMVADMLYDTDLGNNIADTFTKVNNFIKNFAGEGTDDSRSGGTEDLKPENGDTEDKNNNNIVDSGEKEAPKGNSDTENNNSSDSNSDSYNKEDSGDKNSNDNDESENGGSLPIPTIKSYSEYAKDGTHEGVTNIVMLGKYKKNDTSSYERVARSRDATYFELENWNNVESKVGKENMWNINKVFLDQQWEAGKEFYFSHDPWKADGYYQEEVLYLIDLGVTDFVKDGDLWKAVRPK